MLNQLGQPTTPLTTPIEMKLSRFDAVAAFLSSMAIFLGILVAFMFVVWAALGERDVPSPEPISPQIRAASVSGVENDFEIPGQDEVEDLQTPNLAETLNAISTIPARVANVLAADTVVTSGDTGSSVTSLREPGPPTQVGGQDKIPRWNRWEIQFRARNVKDYASQLDFFGFELAAFGGELNVIDSVTDLSSRPQRHINRYPESEKRLYFSWKQSNLLQKFDRDLLSKSGVPIAGRSIIRFTPVSLEKTLLELEKDHCQRNGKRFPEQIAKTVFESHAKDDGFEFVVIAQRYR